MGYPQIHPGADFPSESSSYGDLSCIPSRHGDLLSLHRHQGIAPAEGQVWRAAPWSRWQMRSSSPKIMGNCEFTVKDMGKYGNKWGLNPYNWDDLAIGNHKKDLDKSTMRNHQDLS